MAEELWKKAKGRIASPGTSDGGGSSSEESADVKGEERKRGRGLLGVRQVIDGSFGSFQDTMTVTWPCDQKGMVAKSRARALDSAAEMPALVLLAARRTPIAASSRPSRSQRSHISQTSLRVQLLRLAI